MPNVKPIQDNSEQNEMTEVNQVNLSPKPWWHTPISAAIGGAIGGYMCFAFEGLKKRAQSHQIISLASFHPRELFRGSTAFATSVGTTSVAQFTILRLFKNLSNYDAASTTWQISTAMASGMCGAFFSTMVENIILQQQLTKTGPSQAIRELFKQGYTRPWLGLPELMWREGGFALTMLYLASAVGEYIKSQNYNQTYVYAGEIGVGVTGAFLTHPFDTTATYKQKYLVSTKDAVKNIYKDGIAGFYKGVGYRAFLFTGCMLVIPYAEQKASKALKQFSLFCSKPLYPEMTLKEQQQEIAKNIRSHS